MKKENSRESGAGIPENLTLEAVALLCKLGQLFWGKSPRGNLRVDFGAQIKIISLFNAPIYSEIANS